jgi:hypothetical protein
MAYDDNDLRIINAVLESFPQVTRLVDLVKIISSATEYPITSRSRFQELLRNRDEEVLQGSWLYGLPDSIPAYYFPIASEDDLIAKLLDLHPSLYAEAAPRGRQDQISAAATASPFMSRYVMPYGSPPVPPPMSTLPQDPTAAGAFPTPAVSLPPHFTHPGAQPFFVPPQPRQPEQGM